MMVDDSVRINTTEMQENLLSTTLNESNLGMHGGDFVRIKYS